MERKTVDDMAKKFVAEFEASVVLFTGMRELIETKFEQFSKNPNVTPAALKDLTVAIKNVSEAMRTTAEVIQKIKASAVEDEAPPLPTMG